MEYGIYFIPQASEDIRVAHDWYEEQSIDLGKEFIEAVLLQAENLKSDFITHRFYKHPVRYIKIKRFPFTLFFIKDELQRKVIVHAVLHNKQNMLAIIKKRL